MGTLSIVKPDHIGDLVLAAPAIGFLAAQDHSATLFVAPEAMSLAAHLFPTLPNRPLRLPHLEKGRRDDRIYVAEALAEAAAAERTVILRSDHVLNRARLRGLFRSFVVTDSHDRVHESVAQLNALRPFFGPYDRDAHWPGMARPWPEHPRRIALCLGSGFPANRWSVLRWAELGRALLARGVEVAVLSTPREEAYVALVLRALGLDDQSAVPCTSIPDLLRRLADFDLLVASDGGAGHIASLAAPVLTVAGSVPFRRFAPFGRQHRVVSLDLPCSPCINYDSGALNGCFSHECTYGIRAEAVLVALDHPARPPGHVIPLPGGARLFFGPSHA